jgi:Zn-dependent protease
LEVSPLHTPISIPASHLRALLSDGIRLGRILTIPIYIDLSWLVVFGFVAYLNSRSFADLHPQWTPHRDWITAAFATLLFFLCVLLHELAHSVVAQHYRVPVLSITLFLFGGIAQIGREPTKATEEFNIAIAGPLASALLGILFYSPVCILPTNETADALLMCISGANISLALFNLLPGLPLDGGRCLRAVIWGVRKDLRRATRIAQTSGKVVGFCLVSFGLSGFGFGAAPGWGGTGLIFAGSLLMICALANEAGSSETRNPLEDPERSL